MKTKTLLMVCLLMGIGFMQLSAQKGKNGNGSVSEYLTWDGYYIDIPVICGEAPVDRLVGFASVHVIRFCVDGVIVGEKAKFTAQVTNFRTGENFEVKDIYKSDYEDMGGYGHWNLKGDQGSHYKLFYSFEWATDAFTILKANCH